MISWLGPLIENMAMISSPHLEEMFLRLTFEYWCDDMKVFALLHAESFDEISDVIECDGHNGDISAQKD